MNKLGIALLASLGLAACAAPQQGGYGPTALGITEATPDTESEARARIFTDLAGGYFARGQYKIVLQELLKAIQVEPRFAPAYNLYGLVYQELEEYALAEENFRRAIELKPGDSEARNNFGRFLCQRGRYDEGLAELAVALRNPLYDKIELAAIDAGQCGELKGDFDLAESNYQKALKLTPDNPLAVLRLAALRFRQQRYEEARRLLDRLDKLARPGPESLWLGVRVERKLGDARQEAAYAQALRRDFPDSEPARRLDAGNYE